MITIWCIRRFQFRCSSICPFLLLLLVLDVMFRKSLPKLLSKALPLSFTVTGLTLRSLDTFWGWFCVWYKIGSSLHVDIQFSRHHLLKRLSLFHGGVSSSWILLRALFSSLPLHPYNISRLPEATGVKFLLLANKRYTDTNLIAQLVKNLPAMQETWVWSLGGEDPLEKEMAIHSSILVWRIPWTEEPGRLYSPWGFKSWTRLSD